MFCPGQGTEGHGTERNQVQGADDGSDLTVAITDSGMNRSPMADRLGNEEEQVAKHND